MRYDVIIIGGGVLGVSLAYHLMRSGSPLRVLVLEKEAGVAHHASGKNAGMFRHLYRHHALTDWTKRSAESWPSELKAKVFRETGSLVLGRKIPPHHQELFESGLLKLNSRHRDLETSFVFTKKDGLIDSGSYVEGLRNLARQQGADFCFNEKAENISQKGRGWSISLSSGETLQATWIVNAAGAWLNSFADKNNHVSSVAAKAYARYLFLCGSTLAEIGLALTGFSGSYGFFWDEVNEWYFRKWSEDQLLLSVCDVIPGDPDNYSPSESSLMSLSDKLNVLVPDFARSLKLIRSWHCFRTYTEDLLPIWGPDREMPGLFWLAAFGGFGMSTSFAASEDAARYILGENVTICDDFSPERVKVHNTTSWRLSVNA